MEWLVSLLHGIVDSLHYSDVSARHGLRFSFNDEVRDSVDEKQLVVDRSDLERHWLVRCDPDRGGDAFGRYASCLVSFVLDVTIDLAAMDTGDPVHSGFGAKVSGALAIGRSVGAAPGGMWCGRAACERVDCSAQRRVQSVSHNARARTISPRMVAKILERLAELSSFICVRASGQPRPRFERTTGVTANGNRAVE